MNLTSLPNTCHDKLPRAVLKTRASDFRVDEVLGFDPAGDGEHLWVNIRKSGWNTRDVVEMLAKAHGIAAREIGYSGLKDRHAVTSQWLSLPLAKVSDRLLVERDMPQLFSNQSGLECLQVCRSQKKLKTGTHRANSFLIVLRNIQGRTRQMDEALERLEHSGFPNYFGTQRFGHEGSNIARAQAMFQATRKGASRISRFKRGIYLSAARAYLFNLVLADRVQEESWNKVIDGELCMLDGTNSCFPYDACEEGIHTRCREQDIHPSGPLHGRGTAQISGVAAEIESRVLEREKVLSTGLEEAGLKAERRALRARAGDFQHHWLDDETLELGFTLARGVYATALLAEIADITDAAGNIDNLSQDRSG